MKLLTRKVLSFFFLPFGFFFLLLFFPDLKVCVCHAMMRHLQKKTHNAFLDEVCRDVLLQVVSVQMIQVLLCGGTFDDRSS